MRWMAAATSDWALLVPLRAASPGMDATLKNKLGITALDLAMTDEKRAELFRRLKLEKRIGWMVSWCENEG